MSLGLQHALALEAQELRDEHEEEQRIERRKARERRLSNRNRSPPPAALLKSPDLLTEEHTEDLETPLAQQALKAAKTHAEEEEAAAAAEAAKDTESQTVRGANAPKDELAIRDSHQKEIENASSDNAAVTSPSLPEKSLGSEDPQASPTKTPTKQPRVSSKQRAMASVYGKSKLRLPGDLGPGDPRRSLPGDLGPNDPRRPRSIGSKSQSPAGRAPEGVSIGSSERRRRPRRASDGALLKPDAGDRLKKDIDEPGEESSDSDDADDTDSAVESRRGRGRRRSSRSGEALGNDFDSEEDNLTSPLRSPNITVTPPVSDKPERRRSGVHPHSAYDHPLGSAKTTPRNSDDEEHIDDVRRAQRLPLTISPVHSTPSAHRVIRQIIRGDYTHFQSEAEAGRRRQRVYLVATDLSPEAEYALEWTIGTVLRDGDTLLAVYAVDEEAGASGEGVEIGHGADVIKDTARIVGNLPAEKVAQSPAPSPLGKMPREVSTVRLNAESEAMTKAERDRFRAANDISERCIKLMRKTRLQIRVVVEVFHCKSPKHMITEVVSHPTSSNRPRRRRVEY